MGAPTVARLRNFNPRSPYGERPPAKLHVELDNDFNPRSPYGERLRRLGRRPRDWQFQSTLPIRGATELGGVVDGVVEISIHAPHTACTADFNPRSPYGERPSSMLPRAASCSFQSTLPIRGATGLRGRGGTVGRNFNPRSPYGERRWSSVTSYALDMNFNPRSPYGERPFLVPVPCLVVDISIHAPHTGSDIHGESV